MWTVLGDTMARNRGNSTRGQRDLSTLLQPPVARQRLLTPHILIVPKSPLTDRRIHDPTRNARIVSSPRYSRHAIVSKNVDRFGKAIRNIPYSVRFGSPRSLPICAKRRIRKEVLHALRKTGAGSSRKPKRRNFWSNVSC